MTAPMRELGRGMAGWRGAETPMPRVLAGRAVQLEPIDPDRHFTSLYEAARADPATWDYLSAGPFGPKDDFLTWLQWAGNSQDHLFFVVVDAVTGRAEGMASYMRAEPVHGVIEIGYIWFGPRLQRTTAGTEAIFLLLRHAFDDLGYRRLEWKCNHLNRRSRRAAERFGFTFEGIFRQHMVVKGKNRDTAWYAMLDGEWQAVRRAFELWLSSANFDGSGKQHHSLSSIRASLLESTASRRNGVVQPETSGFHAVAERDE